MVDLDGLMDVANNDPHEVRLRARLEQLDPADVLEAAVEGIREAAWRRDEMRGWEDGY